MTRYHAGLTEKEILTYNYEQHKVVNQRNGVKKVTIHYGDGNITLKVMPDGSRTLTTKDQIVTVRQDAETRKVITEVKYRRSKEIRRYVDEVLGSLVGLPAIEEPSTNTKHWYINGVRGRANGLPAIEYGDGSKWWYINGIPGRNGDRPAVEYENGTKVWYINGRIGRDNGLPAIEYADGSKAWYIAGELGREGGLPAEQMADGSKYWYINGELGREGGLPTVVYPDCSAAWYNKGARYTPEGRIDLITEDFTAHYNNGKLHSYDLQPAVTYKDGRPDEYYINGEKTTLELLKLVTKSSETTSRLPNAQGASTTGFSHIKF